MNHDKKLMLVNSIRQLSISAEEQLSLLAQLGCPGNIDELALQLNDQLAIAEQLADAGCISNDDLQNVKKLDDMLRRISTTQYSHLWTPIALSTSPYWETVRHLASELLTQL